MVLVCWMAYLQIMYSECCARRTNSFTARRPSLSIRLPVNMAKLDPSLEAIIKIRMIHRMYCSNENLKQGMLSYSMRKQYVLLHALCLLVNGAVHSANCDRDHMQTMCQLMHSSSLLFVMLL